MARKKAEQAREVELKNLRLERPAYDAIIGIKGQLIVKLNRNVSLSEAVLEMAKGYKKSGVS